MAMDMVHTDKNTILSHFDFLSFYQPLVINLKENGNNQATGLCPFHDDHHPSLSINLDNGLYNCFACNAKGDIFKFYQDYKKVDFKTALKEIAKMQGMSVEAKKKIIKTYDYTDAEGNLIFQCVRYEPKDFRQRRPDGKGAWIYNLHGVTPVIYNLPEVIKAATIFICEGEKDCDNLEAIGITATTSPMGAGKWKDEYAAYLKGKDVVIIFDNDKAGRDHALQVIKSLHGVAKSVKVIELSGLPEKGDVSDWLDERDAKESEIIRAELLGIAENTPDFSFVDRIIPYSIDKSTNEKKRLKLSNISDMLNAEHLKYLVDKVLVKNTLTMLSAYAATGKSLLALAIAYSILTGRKLFDLFTVSETGGVLIIDEENPVAFNKERLLAFSFTPDMPLHFLHYQGVKLDDNLLFTELCELIKGLKPTLVIIDSLIRVHGQKENEAGMSLVMQRLRAIVNLGTTVLIIHHHRKGAGDIREGIRGHSDIIGGVDMALALEIRDDCLLLSHAKSRTVTHEPLRLELKTGNGTLSFKCCAAEDQESMDAVYEILSEHPEGLKQKEIKERIKNELDLTEFQARKLLKKGEGRYWDILDGQGKDRSKYYRVVSFVDRITPYRSDKSTNETHELKANSTNEGSINSPQSLDNPSLVDRTDDNNPINKSDLKEVLI